MKSDAQLEWSDFWYKFELYNMDLVSLTPDFLQVTSDGWFSYGTFGRRIQMVQNIVNVPPAPKNNDRQASNV